MATGFFSTDNSTNVRSLVALARLFPGLASRWAERRFRTPSRRPLADVEPAIFATAESLALGRGRRRVAAWTWGSGPRVVLVHGWGGRAAQLGAFVPALVGAGFSVVAFDAPGHGASGGRLSSIPEFAGALRRVIAATGPAYGVVAHSLGAAATALALRDGLRVERAVFLAPPADPTRYLARFLTALGVAGLQGRIEQRFGRRFRIRFADLDVPRLARRMTVPLLVVHDRADREVPWEDGAAIAGAWPDAELATTAGLGHRRLLGDAEVIARAVGFVGRDGAGHGERCATPGCRRPGVEPWDGDLLCSACALERELFQPDARWRRAAWAGALVSS